MCADGVAPPACASLLEHAPAPTRIGLLIDQNITGHHSAFGFLQVFITNGWLSDLVIVVAITNSEARSPAHGISLFLVENGMKGFIKGQKLHKMGMKAQVGNSVNQIWQFIVHSPSESRYGASFLASSCAGCQGAFSETAEETSVMPLPRLCPAMGRSQGVLSICLRNGNVSFCNCNNHL